MCTMKWTYDIACTGSVCVFAIWFLVCAFFSHLDSLPNSFKESFHSVSFYMNYILRTKESVINTVKMKREWKKTWPFSKWFFSAVVIVAAFWVINFYSRKLVQRKQWRQNSNNSVGGVFSFRNIVILIKDTSFDSLYK